MLTSPPGRPTPTRSPGGHGAQRARRCALAQSVRRWLARRAAGGAARAGSAQVRERSRRAVGPCVPAARRCAASLAADGAWCEPSAARCCSRASTVPQLLMLRFLTRIWHCPLLQPGINRAGFRTVAARLLPAANGPPGSGLALQSFAARVFGVVSFGADAVLLCDAARPDRTVRCAEDRPAERTTSRRQPDGRHPAGRPAGGRAAEVSRGEERAEDEGLRGGGREGARRRRRCGGRGNGGPGSKRWRRTRGQRTAGPG